MRTTIALLTSMFLSASAAAGPLMLRTTDGVDVSAETWGSGKHGVVLIHADGDDRSGWKDFAERLADNDFRVIAIDLRGHGQTGGTLTEADYPKMVADVAAAVTWLDGKGVADVGLVGAELGANLALAALAADEEVDTAVMLSPSLSAHGVKVSSALARIGRRPVLLVASKADSTGARAAGLIEGKATGPKHLALYDGNAVGRKMLNTAPELEGLMVSWLNGTFLQATDSRAASHAEVDTNVDEIETTGERFEENH
jgi:alpha-beta hydrolase superfamily lysophospholipase